MLIMGNNGGNFYNGMQQQQPVQMSYLQNNMQQQMVIPQVGQSYSSPIEALYYETLKLTQMDSFIENVILRDTKLIEAVKPYGWEAFGEGQHRVVFRNKAYPGKVYKVSHNIDGRQDNIGEYALSGPAFVAIRPYIALTTQAMQQGSFIDAIANGGLISEQEEVLCIRDYVYNTEGKDNIGYNSMRFLVKYWANYVDLIGKLSQHVFLFDAHAKSPFNFGLRANGNNGSSLVCLDAGYFLHNSILQQKGLHDGNGIRCGKCGGYMKYHVPNIYGMNEADAIKKLCNENSADSTEKYVCTREGCNNVIAAKDLYDQIVRG